MEKYERLQEACNTLKINRKGLAEILKIHPSNASRLLNGDTEFTWTYAELFQLKTNVSAVWIMEGKGEFWFEESGDGKENLILRNILKIPGLSEVLEKFIKLHQEDQKIVTSLINRIYKLSESKSKK
ncbi:helix-turn-helix domain-containing protein [Leptospira santarosai]|uniref:helix-turn-helix transcriptional regulator n=1 Tax=Leptospira santarosai TaxID=28183 RepID=UPI0022A92AB6|nr:helix-turn-helix transcriptional regulator [Leptospira santarosai]UZN06737.1 helix-turn-helix domain-containing protein [Leptospira santarosai]